VFKRGITNSSAGSAGTHRWDRSSAGTGCGVPLDDLVPDGARSGCVSGGKPVAFRALTVSSVYSTNIAAPRCRWSLAATRTVASVASSTDGSSAPTVQSRTRRICPTAVFGKRVRAGVSRFYSGPRHWNLRSSRLVRWARYVHTDAAVPRTDTRQPARVPENGRGIFGCPGLHRRCRTSIRGRRNGGTSPRCGQGPANSAVGQCSSVHRRHRECPKGHQAFPQETQPERAPSGTKSSERHRRHPVPAEDLSHRCVPADPADEFVILTLEHDDLLSRCSTRRASTRTPSMMGFTTYSLVLRVLGPGGGREAWPGVGEAQPSPRAGQSAPSSMGAFSEPELLVQAVAPDVETSVARDCVVAVPEAKHSCHQRTAEIVTPAMSDVRLGDPEQSLIGHRYRMSPRRPRPRGYVRSYVSDVVARIAELSVAVTCTLSRDSAGRLADGQTTTRSSVGNEQREGVRCSLIQFLDSPALLYLLVRGRDCIDEIDALGVRRSYRVVACISWCRWLGAVPRSEVVLIVRSGLLVGSTRCV